MRSPFKFLDAYTQADEKHFFGREQESEELIKMMIKAPLALLYGLAGTGKTSLARCGLAARLEKRGWKTACIRRGSDFNRALLLALQGAPEETRPADSIRRALAAEKQPLLLIFDQFEDLFILGSWEEQKQLEDTFRQVLDARLRCHILLVMQEEYIGRLFPFEKALPALSRFRFRLAPMAQAGLQDAVRLSCRHFNIKLEPSPGEWLQQFLPGLLAGKPHARLPGLQVYLSRLYTYHYQKKHGPAEWAGQLPPLAFSPDDIGRFGAPGQALENFLQEQELELQARLNHRFPGLPKDTIREVLGLFVSEEGSSRPLHYSGQSGGLPAWGTEPVQPALAELNPTIFSACLSLLEQGRLIRLSGQYAELAHESLAALIDAHRSDEQRRLNEARRRLHYYFLDYQRSGELLSRQQLEPLGEFLPQLQLSPQAEKFIMDSRAHARRLETAEKERQFMEVSQARKLLKSEQKSSRRRRLAFLLAGAGAAVAILLGLWAWNERQQALDARRQAQKETFLTHISTAFSLKQEGRYFASILQLEQAGALAADGPALDMQRDSLLLYQRLAEIMAEADSLARQDSTLARALLRYEEARQLSSDPFTQYKHKHATAEIDRKFDDYLARAKAILEYAGCPFARDVLEKARQLKPDHPELKKLMEYCRQGG